MVAEFCWGLKGSAEDCRSLMRSDKPIWSLLSSVVVYRDLLRSAGAG